MTSTKKKHQQKTGFILKVEGKASFSTRPAFTALRICNEYLLIPCGFFANCKAERITVQAATVWGVRTLEVIEKSLYEEIIFTNNLKKNVFNSSNIIDEKIVFDLSQKKFVSEKYLKPPPENQVVTAQASGVIRCR